MALPKGLLVPKTINNVFVRTILKYKPTNPEPNHLLSGAHISGQYPLTVISPEWVPHSQAWP